MKSRRQYRGSVPSPCESGHISVLTTQEVPLPFPNSSLPLSEECLWFGRRELSTSWVGVLVPKCHLYAPDSYFPCWCSLPIPHWCNPIRIKENQLRVPHSLATVSFKADAGLLRRLKTPRTLKNVGDTLCQHIHCPSIIKSTEKRECRPFQPDAVNLFLFSLYLLLTISCQTFLLSRSSNFMSLLSQVAWWFLHSAANPKWWCLMGGSFLTH